MGGGRGILLESGDMVISHSFQRHADATGGEREAYLKRASALGAAAAPIASSSWARTPHACA
jgi:hypothetical protein